MGDSVVPAGHLEKPGLARRAGLAGESAGTLGRWLAWILSRGTAMPAIASLILIGVFFQWQSQHFLSAGNLSNLAVQCSLVAVLALGEVVVLLLAEIDLSLGSVAGVTAAILGVSIAAGLPWWLSVILMLLAGAIIGAFQGWWIAWLGIPSFVVTLAGMLGFLGMQLWVLGPQGTLSIFDSTIAALTGTTLPPALGWVLAGLVVVVVAAVAVPRLRHGIAGIRSMGMQLVVAALIVVTVALFNASRGVPTALLALLVLLSVAWWITQFTRPGRHLFAVGGNPEAARRAGVPVRRIRLAAFTISGTLAAVGGLFAASYNGSAGTLTGGGTLLLEAIGAAVIGGTSLFGGRGTVWSALFGALIMGGVANGLDLMNAEQPVKYMVQGVIVLLAVSLDTILRRYQSRGRQLGSARA